MLQFDPFLPIQAIIALAIAYCLLWVLLYRRLLAIIMRRTWYALMATKALGVVLLTVLLLNPYWVEQEPDQRRFQHVVLADVTGSMAIGDCRERQRIEVMKEDFLSPDSSFYQRVFGEAKPTFYAFSGAERRRFSPQADLAVLPGDTDIDAALAYALAQSASNAQIGAVLLLSDGQDNVERPLSAAGSLYRQAGIPVHVIGIGERDLEDDIGVAWSHTPDTGIKGKPVSLTATVRRTTSGAMSTEVSLTDGLRELASKTVRFGPGEKAADVTFEATPFVAGFTTYQVRVPRLQANENALNNVDFAGIEIRSPDEFNTFYYAANVGWDYKFLRGLAKEREKIILSCVIRTGTKTFHVDGVEREGRSASGFPSMEELAAYECLIVDLGSLYLLSEEEIERLAIFVERRGGGVLCTGHTAECPERIQRLLPAVKAPAAVTQVAATPISVHQSHAFADLKARELRQITSGLALPDFARMARLESGDLKPGASVLADVDVPPWAALAVHNYGAGKVALMNLTDTWQWVMNEDRGRQYYAMLWGKLIAWASSASQDRLTVRPAPGKLLVGQPVDVIVDVLTPSFEPDARADIRCELRRQNGEVEPLRLFASARVDGRYEGRFVPERTGECRLQVVYKGDDGQALEESTDYLAVEVGLESQPMPLAEQQLQGLARVTGGIYQHYRDADAIDSLPVNEKVEMRTITHPFADAWWWLLVVVIAVLPDWILRRRTGLA